MRQSSTVAALVVVVVLWAASVSAQTAQTQDPDSSGLGVRAGASGDPSQFYFGGHYESKEIVDRLRFRPNLEIGVGADQTLYALNFEFAYTIPVTNWPWNVYVGAGPALNVIHVTNNTDSEGGFNLLFGLAHQRGLFTEIKIGVVRSPSFKFGVGYTFRQ